METAKFPEKLAFLFEPAPYKTAHGGRGSGKSWGFARALLILGAERPLRILCAREVQKSIEDSVHTLLKDQIAELGLSDFYEVLAYEIRGKNGTTFAYSGLAQHTVTTIKSFEGVDICWVEEAQAVSKKSWDVLRPTIRKPGSEIWITFNPELETDVTYQMFVATPPTGAMVVQMNFNDNPWFTDKLEQERLDCLQNQPKDYDNIWGGVCKPAVAGAIYYDEMTKVEADRRICNIPYDPMLKVHVVFDLGWNDAMAISLVQKHSSELRIIEYIEDNRRTLDSYSADLKLKGYNWGNVYLPHDGEHKNIQTGKSAKEIMEALGWSVRITPNMSVEDGIRVTRMAFGRMYFDKDRTARLVQCAKRYRRSINKQTNEPGAPLHDEWSHGADNLRYVAINADDMRNEEWGGSLNYRSLGST
ncbi:PBSX family phage terminase large subunit [Massilia oculi]|uniref:PBSX family phage terminase large subunit n=1 Tax=Massilia oculi TaxID=945844 RepID=A0A2S2DDH2_9BURK|nr:PBSX family phage terminase large subunit [Massilia oculi]AWL03394.1 PBSX family phage terminase large subunit [Massilia oculi]